MNDCIPYYDDGDNITGYCTSAVTGKTFVKISGTRTGGVFDPTQTAPAADGGAPSIAPADAAGRVFGVAAYDGAQHAFVNVIRGSKLVVPVTASGALNAFDEVEVATGGKATALDTGVAVGYVLADCADGADAQVSLY